MEKSTAFLSLSLGQLEERTLVSWFQVMGCLAALVGREQVKDLQMRFHFFIIGLGYGLGSGMFRLTQGWASDFSGFGRQS